MTWRGGGVNWQARSAFQLIGISLPRLLVHRTQFLISEVIRRLTFSFWLISLSLVYPPTQMSFCSEPFPRLFRLSLYGYKHPQQGFVVVLKDVFLLAIDGRSKIYCSSCETRLHTYSHRLASEKNQVGRIMVT